MERTPLSKLCEVEDFGRPDLRRAIREVFAHELGRFGPDFPDGVEYRKHWEVAMAILALERTGNLNPDADVLGVGAGNEPTVFWLSDRVHRVFATDLYLDPDDWGESANAAMLVDPGRYWPGRWNPRRLVVQHMDGRDLRHPDSSFDGIFSSSSIEHFGDLDDVAASLCEMARVVKPGGVVSVSTEFRLAGPPPGLPGILMFDEAQLRELLDRAGLEPVEPLHTSVSERTRGGAKVFLDSAADVRAHVSQHGEILFHRLDWSAYPQLVLEQDDLCWTSVHLALRRR